MNLSKYAEALTDLGLSSKGDIYKLAGLVAYYEIYGGDKEHVQDTMDGIAIDRQKDVFADGVFINDSFEEDTAEVFSVYLEARAAARNLVNAAVDGMDEETRGRMPGFFITEVSRINEPPVIRWEQVLKKYVGTIPAGKRKTKTRLNRRQPQRYDLSGAVADKVLKIVICLDTSGSVSDGMISEIVNEVFAIVAKRRKEITIIECDDAVQRVYTLRKPEDLLKKVYGRGGTSFTPAIEYVNSNRYFRDALMVYFTDGYGETKIPRPLVYRALWVVYGKTSNLSVKNPYGDVVSMNKGF